MDKIQIRVTGQTGKIDGHVESILGTFAMMGVLLKRKLSKRVRPNGITQIYIDLELKPPPLGNLGEDDIPDVPDDFED